MPPDDPPWIRAHKRSSNHRAELEASTTCGCFYCLSRFSPTAIEKWVGEDEQGLGKDALCPKCGIDSVIGDASGFPVTEEFLRMMQTHWFWPR